MKRFKSIIYILSINILTACSFVGLDSTDLSQSESNPASRIIASSRLYLSSGLFGLKEFEQYSLSDSALFYECGRIRSGKPYPLSSFILNLDQDLRDQLSLSILELVGAASVNSKFLKNNLADKNSQASLDVTTVDGKTAKVSLNFKQVLSGSNDLETKFSELISSFRSIVKSEKSSEDYCEHEHFYGLE